MKLPETETAQVSGRRVLLEHHPQGMDGDVDMFRHFFCSSPEIQKLQSTFRLLLLWASLPRSCRQTVGRCSTRILFVFHPIHHLRIFSLPRHNSDTASVKQAPSAPPLSPLRYVPSLLYRKYFSPFFPRRFASNCIELLHRIALYLYLRC